MNTRLITLAAALSSAAAALNAGVLVNRPLPSANLNNAAGANRSNVAWAESATYNGANWTYGDDFSIGAAGESYLITDLRLWVVSSANSLSDVFSSLSLLSGKIGSTPSNSASCADTTSALAGQGFSCLDASGIANISTVNTAGDPNVNVALATYSDNSTYESGAGSPRNIFEITFQNLNWTVDGGAGYAFFLTGVPGAIGNGGNSPFLHFSNKDLSGNAQQGADNLGWELALNGSTPTLISQWNSLNNGWDKSSDANVQIFGDQVPEPATIGMFGAGLLAVGLLRRRKA